MTSSRMRGGKTRSPMKRERDLNFRKGAGLVSVNERVRTQRTASSLSKGSRREHQPGRAPWTRVVTSSQNSRQCERKAGVRSVTRWEESARTHSSVMSDARKSQTSAPPRPLLQSAHQFLTPESKREPFWGSVLFVVPGGRRAQVSPRVLRVSELQGGDWGQGHLCPGGAIQTLLVRPPHQFL